MADPIGIMSRFKVRAKGVIHVGANKGQEIEAYFQANIKAALLIEPLDSAFNILSERALAYKDYYPVKALCGDVDGQPLVFHVADNSGQSSSLLEPKRHITEHPNVKFTSTIDLESITLDTLLRNIEKDFPDRKVLSFDLLCIDTQGSELMVLQGAESTLKKIKAIWVEVSHGGLYHNDSRLIDVMKFLDRQGFNLVYIEMNRHLWGDALFIRK